MYLTVVFSFVFLFIIISVNVNGKRSDPHKAARVKPHNLKRSTMSIEVVHTLDMREYKCGKLFPIYKILLISCMSSPVLKREERQNEEGCNLSLKKDFGSPFPVFLHNGNFLAPNTASGDILLRRSEILNIACPGNQRTIVLGNNATELNGIVVKCVKDTTFRATKMSWVGDLKDIKCNGSPWFSTEDTGASCSDGYKIYRVGYRIENKFYKLYEACFDNYLLHTLFVKHELKPGSTFVQGGSRPQFIEGDLFGDAKMSKLYSLQHQKSVLGTILGKGMEDEYITKKQFLNRGHLAPRADFPLLAEQRATFHYINAAPQWMRGNAGDWAALEDAIRRRVRTHGKPLTVFTGTYGVCTLADRSSQHQNIYLDVDENNNGILPVPLYFYKVVYDPLKQTAVAFLSINSSFYNRTTIKELSFCNDICDQNRNYAWLKWRPNDGTHSFCCTYEDFIQTIDDFPKLDVKGTFY